MIWNILSAVGSLLAAVVLLAGSIAAVLQLKHLRLSNQLSAYLDIEREYHSPELLAARMWLEAQDFNDPVVLEAAVRDGGDPRIRTVGNYLEGIAQLVNDGVLDKGIAKRFLAAAPFYWKFLKPVALELRSQIGLPVWVDVEYLVYRYATGRSKLKLSTDFSRFLRESCGIADPTATFVQAAADALSPPTERA